MTTSQPPVELFGLARTPRQLGDALAVLRADRGITQGELASLADVPRRFVNELEGGHSTLYLSRLFDVLDALGYRLRVEPAPEPLSTSTEPQITDLGW